jgi:hypothetical protein
MGLLSIYIRILITLVLTFRNRRLDARSLYLKKQLKSFHYITCVSVRVQQ